VRGLDYYCHTVFEFTTNALGSQNAVLAGGRYDNLISDMGGPKTPGVGFAAGVDRLTLMLEELPNEVRPVAIVPLGEEAEKQALLLAQELRLKGLSVELGYSGNMAKRLKRAAGLNSRFAVIFGSDELGKGVVQLKDLDKGEQIEVSRTELHARLQS
jgi:histidyl-tRNA synthetase